MVTFPLTSFVISSNSKLESVSNMETYTQAIIRLQGRCNYNEASKIAFRRASMRFLKELRTLLMIEADIRFNPGGIAVSGEATLHGDNIYVQVSADISHLGIMYRTCKGRKDYTGGPNCWMPFSRLSQNGINGLVAEVKSLIERSKQ
jgi:hypothetical protein